MNTGAPWPSPDEAEARVLEIQTKLHRWAGENEGRRFDDLSNLVYDPAFLLVAWRRVRENKGARTAGVDGESARSIETNRGVEAFLDDLRDQLKERTFRPQPVRWPLSFARLRLAQLRGQPWPFLLHRSSHNRLDFFPRSTRSTSRGLGGSPGQNCLPAGDKSPLGRRRRRAVKPL